MNIFAKIFGTRNDKILSKIRPLVDKINSYGPDLESLDNPALQAKTGAFRERLSRGEDLDAILPEAYAVCREASRRTLDQRHFDVQMFGGIILHQGKIAEMKTGEGKTLTATLPCYLHGLAGHGAHVVTVNDYLARRDAEWMAAIYRFLGLEVGAITNDLGDRERQEAYRADITYGTNNEFGFDFLRDNMKTTAESMVQRGHSFAIVDEVDSILIDEARTPLIISGPTDTDSNLYKVVNSAIPGLQKDSDYIVDEKHRGVVLTEDGIGKLEQRLHLDNLYDPKNISYLHHCQQALKAHVVFKKDVDYVVRGDEVLIVDEFTGRLMPGRRYSDGLHGALEAKEHVPVQQETQTMATITFQNYFRLYRTLSGMTGTADTEAVEFKKIYNLDVVVVPTNRTLVRKDEEDVIYLSAKEKYQAIAEEISKAQQAGQPVLVGTVSVEKSELLSKLLSQRKIEHSILNAKNHAGEAEVISRAGEKSRVTISTNMAGRGTDIKLGEGVKDAGGLYVIGTERHESRRIDNQLRGRSGRQGDPGRTKFFLSLEDDLMRIFASDRLSNIMGRLGMAEGEAIVSPMVTRAIEKAQRRVEEQNFSNRKHVLEYDDVMSQQRQVVYDRRQQSIRGEVRLDFFEETVVAELEELLIDHSPAATGSSFWDLEVAGKAIKERFGQEVGLEEIDREDSDSGGIVTTAKAQILAEYEKKFKGQEDGFVEEVENFVYLGTIDRAWKDHLLAMDSLKDSVSLRSYGQREPLQEYKREAFQLFTTLVQQIQTDTVIALLRLTPPKESRELEVDSPDLEVLMESGTAVAASREDEALFKGAVGGEGSSGGGGGGGTGTSPDEGVGRKLQPIRREEEKVGRNDPCPCGSGKKYKKCHGR